MSRRRSVLHYIPLVGSTHWLQWRGDTSLGTSLRLALRPNVSLEYESVRKSTVRSLETIL